ncbi:hypothetical protein H181DRAFT_04143 [Streptomyces sp. WMMB 714]|uniref:hypothetical protein n=1 Tax=Streptomyces sp. WMMB 714 TaxID=1286822 RepID=UPI0005F76E0F|nr:hypothetical protein [Streptomyces sp. WMMB 714]SCK46503.1 hypothetical protein H181DRAFT_04143 [Streptomyces sp. WMMB 714]
MIKVKTTTVALTTVAALLATGGAAAAVATSDSDAGPAAAGTSGTQAKTAKHAPKGDGAKRLCKRAPKIDKRIDRVLRRLDGDVKKRGSLERLEKRISNAKKAGHDDVAKFLGERLKDRRALGPRLEDRQKDLADLRKWCAEQKDEKEKETDKG